MFNPFIHLISNVISFINLALIVWVVLDICIQYNIVNSGQPLVDRVYSTLTRLIEPLLRPIRNVMVRFMPPIGIDLSPLVLVLALMFLDDALYSWFYSFGV